MGIQAFISGMWRTPKRGEAYINGAWRRLIRGEAYIGGQWRAIASFVGPLSVSSNNAVGTVFSNRAQRVNSQTVTAMPSGGLGPYSYVWTILSGPAQVAAPTNASTLFYAIVNPSDVVQGTARVTVTDALGSTAQTTISITLSNESLG